METQTPCIKIPTDSKPITTENTILTQESHKYSISKENKSFPIHDAPQTEFTSLFILFNAQQKHILFFFIYFFGRGKILHASRASPHIITPIPYPEALPLYSGLNKSFQKLKRSSHGRIA